MKFNKKHLLGSTVLFGVAAVAIAAPTASFAQAKPAAAPAAAADEVIVTGSRIRRDPTNSPTALIQVGREEIQLSGEPNIVDFLADIPALSGSVVPEDTTGSNLNDGGLSLLNLRDLGTVRTLVLVDGRRHVGSSPGTLSVDVDTIPSQLVQSVEIVTGGQSALYGADAVSGVVNFILRRDFEGVEVDGGYSQINQDGQTSRRLSALVGHNFFDGKLNLYGFAERQEFDQVTDFDIDYRRAAWGLTGNDADPAANPNDGDLDNILLRDRRDAYFSRGGILVLSNQARPSATDDPDIGVANCGTGVTGTLSANCTNISKDIPNTTFTFNKDGTLKAFDFGRQQPQVGNNRRVNVGGDGLNTGTEFGQTTRVPESEANRFQVGFNFNITPDVQLFGEAKYVKETTYDESQPTFFQLTLQKPTSVLTGSSTFRLKYDDNAFLLDKAPGLISLIDANTRPTYGAPTATAPGAQTGTILDQRAFLGIFGPSRSQLNKRDLKRFVLGARGEADKFAFVKNVSWEIGYTYGEMNNSNRERGVDSERFFYAADAVRDTANVLGKGVNSVVCRVQLQTAGGATVSNIVGRPVNGTTPATLGATDPAISGCTPISLFGSDFRADANNKYATGGGGRPGLTAAQAAYILTEIEVTDRNRQQDFLTFASGELWDFWGAGPIGMAIGYEHRLEETQGTGRDRDTAGRLLFLNTGPDFKRASYDVDEFFTEVRLPLLKNLPMAESVELSGAYRTSDYSTVGRVETWSTTGQWRPSKDMFFRMTYGKATRIPNLGENFRPATQTFGNGLVDPCAPGNIRGQTQLTAAQRDKLRANCVATMPAGYDPGTDVSNTGSPSTIAYASGIPGFSQGNKNLKPEESRSYTLGAVFTPRFLPRFAATFDYYDIRIDDVIASVSVQQAMNQCVGLQTNDVASVNPGACSTFSRSAVPQIAQQPAYGVYTFVQGSLNYASTLAKGIDFSSRYAIDLDNLFGKDLGRLTWSLRGNYLIRQQDFVNIAVPSEATNNDSTIGLPRVRFLQTVSWAPNPKLTVSWNWDWQQSQEILDDRSYLTNADGRPFEYYNTGAFSQHNFNFRYDVTERLTLRGGVVNAFDAEPARWLGSTTSADNFDLFGRRFFIGANYRY